MSKADANTTLISAWELADQISNPDWVIVDCRFSLDDTERGRSEYLHQHIPGAQYAHLDEDLSGEIVPGITGRHPLPEIEVLSARLSALGIDDQTQVVAYDDVGGAIAARLWWMLKWLGHDAAAVLDGGWVQWKLSGLEVRGGPETRQPKAFIANERPEMLVTAAEVESIYQDPQVRLIDSRTLDRYRGENETLDPVAGHIPGAVCLPYTINLDEKGLFLRKSQLQDRFTNILEGRPPGEAVFYCGSGVTAAHNLLAMAYAGLDIGRLYAGSWSEWITDKRRAVTCKQQ